MKYVEQQAKHSKTAYRALTLSGISLVSAALSVVFLPFILSPLAIIFSHLSKGRLKTKHFAAQAATVIAILALILNTAIIGITVYRYKYDPVYRANIESIFVASTGMTVDEYTNYLLETSGVTLPSE